MKNVIYHNPRCSKSRQALEMLQAKNIDIKVVEYMKTPLDEVTIRHVLQALDCDVKAITRTKNPLYEELKLEEKPEDETIKALCLFPELLERPIVILGDIALVARPPKRLERILEDKPV